MRAGLKSILLAAVAVTALAGGASAAERQLHIETVDLWSWRGRPATQATAVQPMAPIESEHAIASGSSAMQAIPVAMAPDASTQPMPETDTSQMLSTPMIPVRPEASDDVRKAWGCVIGGTTGTVVTLAAGAENLINVIAGGLVAPASPAVLAIGLAGVVFATFCTLGQQFTPMYVYYFDNPEKVPTPAPAKETAQIDRGPIDRGPVVIQPADVVINLSEKW
ncbi:hypothetical protein [Azospirillum sp.]|uniref:hypothetical protein n=1 Tax=Azospirillum sp. TaxID=34012 RepID=UPI002D28DDA6|nr:hypothetical protein [Azospirillum sp.]HYD68300.1 hypothetical protein [Azospirillum sp.]